MLILPLRMKLVQSISKVKLFMNKMLEMPTKSLSQKILDELRNNEFLTIEKPDDIDEIDDLIEQESSQTDVNKYSNKFKKYILINDYDGFKYKNDYTTDSIIPEIIIRKTNGKYIAKLNEIIYPNIYLKNIQKMNNINKYDYESAVWFIRTLQYRLSLIMRIVEIIIDYQSEYLEKGLLYLKPLTQKMISETLKIDESTVSRAISGKSIETLHGIIGIKELFSSALGNNDDQFISVKVIKEMIKIFTDNESKNKPFTDQELVNKIFDELNIKIARRTISKYREELNIKVAGKRKI